MKIVTLTFPRSALLFYLTCVALLPTSLLSEDYTVSTAKIIKLGKELYKKKCTRCHGSSGDGKGLGAHALNPPPRNFRSDVFKFGSEPQQVFETITKGSPGTGMLPQKDRFSIKERWALTHYVLSLRGSPTEND